MESSEEHKGTGAAAEEIRRISIISAFALILLGFSVILDGPVTVLAWILTAAALLCLLYVVIASRSLLNQNRSISRKADTK